MLSLFPCILQHLVGRRKEKLKIEFMDDRSFISNKLWYHTHALTFPFHTHTPWSLSLVYQSVDWWLVCEKEIYARPSAPLSSTHAKKKTLLRSINPIKNYPLCSASRLPTQTGVSGFANNVVILGENFCLKH